MTPFLYFLYLVATAGGVVVIGLAAVMVLIGFVAARGWMEKPDEPGARVPTKPE